MERLRVIDSGEAMRWNADVERRRRAYHERRCAEDPIYKRAYDRYQEMQQRLQKMNSLAMAQLQNAMAEADLTKCSQMTDQLTELEAKQKVKSHIEVMQERQALMDKMEKRHRDSHVFIDGGDALVFSTLVMLLDNPEIQQYVKELEEEIPYTKEIQKADKDFDEELIRMSGFEW